MVQGNQSQIYAAVRNGQDSCAIITRVNITRFTTQLAARRDALTYLVPSPDPQTKIEMQMRSKNLKLEIATLGPGTEWGHTHNPGQRSRYRYHDRSGHPCSFHRSHPVRIAGGTSVPHSLLFLPSLEPTSPASPSLPWRQVQVIE